MNAKQRRKDLRQHARKLRRAAWPTLFAKNAPAWSKATPEQIERTVREVRAKLGYAPMADAVAEMHACAAALSDPSTAFKVSPLGAEELSASEVYHARAQVAVSPVLYEALQRSRDELDASAALRAQLEAKYASKR